MYMYMYMYMYIYIYIYRSACDIINIPGTFHKDMNKNKTSHNKHHTIPVIFITLNQKQTSKQISKLFLLSSNNEQELLR